jgi:hypothetical protein
MDRGHLRLLLAYPSQDSNLPVPGLWTLLTPTVVGRTKLVPPGNKTGTQDSKTPGRDREGKEQAEICAGSDGWLWW